MEGGEAGDAEAAGGEIQREGGGADDFGECAGGEAAEGVHLPEAVLGGDEALEEDGVGGRGGFDVGDAAFVADDFCRGGDGGVEGAGGLRERAPCVPVGGKRESDSQNRYACIEDSEESSAWHRDDSS